MRRREFITLLGSAAGAWPLSAHSEQSDRMRRRIGVLTLFAENDLEAGARITAFRKTLSELGWTEGRNLRIDYRWGAGSRPVVKFRIGIG
jgi:putative ABC transport system substrate-binding protein